MRKRKTAPVLISILVVVLLSGCIQIKPTYTKEKIVDSIVSLCLKEYNIEPKVWLLKETVWIYIPVGSLVTSNLQLDKESMENVNKVMVGASRVVLSMNPRPQFMAVVVSDTEKYGLDYTIITWIPDIVKFQLQLISRDEFMRRNLVKISENINALADTEGLHLEKKDIEIKDFLSEQIAQRIRMKFTLDENLKGYFKVGKIECLIEGDTFKVRAQIEKIKPLPKNEINIEREIARIVSYVIKEYEVKDFLLANIENTATGKQLLFTRSELADFLR